MATELQVIHANLLPEASNITDADMILIIQSGRPKRALPSAMKGDKGDNVYMGLSDTHILWKIGMNGSWQNLIAIESLRGKQGYKPVFRKVGGTLQVKYENEDDSAYVNIFDAEELSIKFSDLTEEEIEKIKLHLSDLTAEDIATLQQPATEAAAEVRQAAIGWENEENVRKSNEAERIEAEEAREAAEISRSEAESIRQTAETARETAESTREENETERQNREATRYANESARQLAEDARSMAEQERKSNEDARKASEIERDKAESDRGEAEDLRNTNEDKRIEAELARKASELARIDNESNREASELERQNNELQRQSDTATAINNAEIATTSANEAANRANNAAEYARSVSDNLPKIENMTWRVFNPSTNQYEDSGVDATGRPPIIQGDTWWIWDYAKQIYVDSGKAVNTAYKAYVPIKYPKDIDLTTLSTYEEDGEVKDFISGNLIYVENELEPTGYSVYIYTPHGAGYAWVKIVLITDGMHLILVNN